MRGRHRLGPLGVRLRDPFGLSTRVAAISGSSDILVLPRILPLGGGQPPGSGVGAEGAIPHMVALHGEDDVSIRSYRDGDDLRRIHWPATAKTGELMVRQEDRPARRRAARECPGNGPFRGARCTLVVSPSGLDLTTRVVGVWAVVA
ncbi:hypothetical protein BJM39_09955 [Salmonella enterica subsp. enterica serovar Javiana]|nr:hypothetical protein BJM39_09955 [Salmonella enterica subsp. enterica serovar Javiana]